MVKKRSKGPTRYQFQRLMSFHPGEKTAHGNQIKSAGLAIIGLAKTGRQRISLKLSVSSAPGRAAEVGFSITNASTSRPSRSNDR